MVIQPSGRVLTLAVPDGRDDSRLRRAQALAPWTSASLVLARELNQRKLDGYLAVLDAVPVGSRTAQAVEACRRANDRLAQAGSIRGVRVLEGDAGIPYHGVLADTPVFFREGDRVPEHWRRLGSRGSPLSANARSATSPGQSLRNVVGGLAAAEIAVACRTIGLDPGMGIGLHADVRDRQSLVWEVMEAVRPSLDLLTLTILGGRVWRRGDFHELATGEVRLRPDWPVIRPRGASHARSLVADITHRLHEVLRRTQLISHVVERVATVIAENGVEPPGSRKTTGVYVGTVLSGDRHKRARRAERDVVITRVEVDRSSKAVDES